MRDNVTMDKADRIVLPKGVRDGLHLTPGDTLVLAMEGEQVTLRPPRTMPPLQKERGVWVFRTGDPLSAQETSDALRGIREQRSHRNAGDAGR